MFIIYKKNNKMINQNLFKPLNLFFFFIPIFFVIGPSFFEIYINISSVFFIIYAIIYKRKIIYEKIFLYPLLIIFIYLNFISIFSLFKFDAYTRSIFFFRYIIIFIFISTLLYHFKFKQLKYMFASSSLISYLIVINLIYQFFFKIDLFGNASTPYRMSGFFGDELIAGQVLFILSMPALMSSYFFLKSNSYMKLFFMLTSVTILIGILLSGQRTSLFNYLISLFLFLFFFKENFNFNLKKIFFSIFLIFFILIWSINDFYIRFVVLLSKQVNNFFNTSYSAFYETGINLWLKNPFLGVGLKNYRHLCENELYFSNYKGIPCANHPHNIYIEILSELGIFGLIIFLFLFILVTITSLKNMINSNHESKVYFGPFFLVILPIMFTIFPSASFFTNTHSVPFWLYFSLASMLGVKKFNKN
tara:strand:+ start:42 stop:1295 length:1254 start_codon:yes stop_codon:yes gene_type:complete